MPCRAFPLAACVASALIASARATPEAGKAKPDPGRFNVAKNEADTRAFKTLTSTEPWTAPALP